MSFLAFRPERNTPDPTEPHPRGSPDEWRSPKNAPAVTEPSTIDKLVACSNSMDGIEIADRQQGAHHPHPIIATSDAARLMAFFVLVGMDIGPKQEGISVDECRFLLGQLGGEANQFRE